MVAVVSHNAQTLTGLESYLRGAGIRTIGYRNLEEVPRIPSLDALVVFPDDFAWETVLSTIAELAERRPRALPVLVTSHPQRFSELTAARVLMVPRPAWSWKILEAIQAHVEAARRAGSRRGKAR